jgi:hypothetical protein
LGLGWVAHHPVFRSIAGSSTEMSKVKIPFRDPLVRQSHVMEVPSNVIHFNGVEIINQLFK